MLVVGESDTGKELVARALHDRSRRTGRFVPVNVTALPAAVFESELFGHLKGAFTGAERDKVGLFEAAERGTLFLDAIGDLPGELQPKLLRAIEEKMTRPIGSVARKPVDVRIVASTNAELRELANAGRFRVDLRIDADRYRGED